MKSQVPTPTRPSLLFPGQNDNEEILIFVRRHWMPFTLWIFLILIMLLIPIVIAIIVFVALGPPKGDRIIYIGLGMSAYLLFVNAIFLTAWIEQYLDVSIITTDRLVHIRQIGLFNRRVAELSLSRVQDVSAHMHGYLQSILQFGTVVVETAGGSPDFVIRNVSKPHVVANTILMIHDRLRVAQAVEPNKVTVQETELVPVLSGTIQEAIVQHTPSIAPPSDYHHEHFQEDLFTQALDAQEEDREQQVEATALEPIKPIVPNRLPPNRKKTSKVEGELVEGQDISID
jgi:hypothetical protein